MSERVSRTFIGSIVCVDLVGYSTRSVAQQITIKEAFNRLLAQALEKVPEEDRIILDTGDGAAISFLGDPEQSLAVGLAVRDAMLANATALGAASGAESPVRMGINLGPVKLAVDMNGYPKIIGDGLNVAERIMGFAKPGQIAVSRSFFEMVSRLSDDNAKLFRLDGVRTDKNAREHQVYIVEPGAAPPKLSGRAGSTAAPGALVAFLEDKLKVGSAAVLLLALILAEGAFLARKWRAPVPAMASAPTPGPSQASPIAKPEPVKPAPSKPVELPPLKAEPEPAAAKAEPAKPETKPETKPEAKPEPVKPARKDEAPAKTAAAESPSPVPANLVAIGSLNFPAEAAARGINVGQVRARLTIDAAGNVTRVQVLEARPRRFFDEEATRSLREWKFDRGPPNRTYVADIEFKR